MRNFNAKCAYITCAKLSKSRSRTQPFTEFRMFHNSLLFQFKHGDHTCVFYRNEDSLREVLTPYIADGLRRGERCFCAQAPQICKRLVFDLQFLRIDTDSAIRRGALEIHSFDEVYFPNRKFEPN